MNTPSLPRELLTGDVEEMRIGLRIANAIWTAVYAAPIPDLVIPTPLPCSPCLHPKRPS